MLAKTIVLGIAALIGVAPVAAQQSGTLEFGAFGSSSIFDAGLGMKNSFGLGGRIGVFVAPRVSFEFEAGGSKVGRTVGLQEVNVGVLAARVTAVPFKFGAVSILFGGGIDHIDTQFTDSYGVEGLLGAKLTISDAVALRIDRIQSYMATGQYTNVAWHMGFTLYRNPLRRDKTLSRPVDLANRGEFQLQVADAYLAVPKK